MITGGLAPNTANSLEVAGGLAPDRQFARTHCSCCRFRRPQATVLHRFAKALAPAGLTLILRPSPVLASRDHPRYDLNNWQGLSIIRFDSAELLDVC